jgi:succinate dehydrogenase / fumarate reductase cytochrome b subunit
MRERRFRENYLGISGWAWGGRYRLERRLYILHRISGLGLLLYGVLHFTVMTFFRLPGEGIYEATMRFLANPAFKVGEFLVLAAFVFHSVNGFRLILQELGFLLGRPVPPIFPYRDSLQKNRPWVLGTVGIIAVLLLIVLYDFVA